MRRAIWDRNCVLDQKQLQARPKGDHTDYQKSTNNQSKDELDLSATSTQHQPKNLPASNQKLIRNRSRIVPESTKIDKKSTQIGSKIGVGDDLATGTEFGPILLTGWVPSGVVLGAKLGSGRGHVSPKIDFGGVLEGAQKWHRNLTHVGNDLGPILDRFRGAKWNQNRSKIDVKSDRQAYTCILDFLENSRVNQRCARPKITQIPTKSRLKSDLK